MNGTVGTVHKARWALFFLAGMCISVGNAQQSITLDEAVSRVADQTKGRVLSAEPTEGETPMRYRIKLLTGDGTVTTVYVDPQTGRIEN